MNESRRVFLTSAVAAGASLAGCLGDESGSSGGGGASDSSGTASRTTGRTVSPDSQSPSGSTPTGSESTTASSDSAAGTTAGGTNAQTTREVPDIDHPAATALDSQPFLGPTPGTVPSIIAFEDPSCTNCERFNTTTFPDLESRLMEPGKVSYVYRHFPYAFEWGKPAMAALEATYARDEGAFWTLKEHYFSTQSEFGEANVLERTEEFLASETALDAAAVIEDVRAGAYDRAVGRDVSAGEAAGVVSTPTFFLFRDGRFLTEIRGAQSYQVFAQALGVR